MNWASESEILIALAEGLCIPPLVNWRILSRGLNTKSLWASPLNPYPQVLKGHLWHLIFVCCLWDLNTIAYFIFSKYLTDNRTSDLWENSFHGMTLAIEMFWEHWCYHWTECWYLCLNAILGCLWQDSERAGRHNSGSSSKLQVSGLIVQPAPSRKQCSC